MTKDITLGLEAPTLLLVEERGDRVGLTEPLLATAGWRIASAQSGRDATIMAANLPVALVLMAPECGIEGHRLVDRIRAVPGASAVAPIVMIGQTDMADDDPKWCRVDMFLPRSLSPEALLQRLEDWRPLSLESTRRIAAMFGAGPIAGMIERLARRLEAAVGRLESGTIDQAEAHRLAGLCGTLGFGQAHAAWLDLSLGDDSSINEVRRTTRLTLAAIARGL